MSGLFVTFEGADGAGKSTQLRLAAERLRAAGADVATTREPGGSAGGEEIRALLVSGAPGRWSAETELLLFTAARRDHLETVIEPALARGAVVLCDRYVDSTRAYQAAGRGAPRELVETLHRAVIGRDPDVTLVFDLDPAIAAARRAGAERPEIAGAAAAATKQREARFERFGPAFQEALRAAFLAIAAAEPARCRVIDAAAGAAAVAETVARAIDAAVAAKRGSREPGG
ncbi:MAG: dTMP kinase [Pseudomonadota bacterium]